MSALRDRVMRARRSGRGCLLASLRRQPDAGRRPPVLAGAEVVVSVVELAAHGLDQHPAALGVRWPDSGLVACRRHLLDPTALRTTMQLRASDDVAVVVFDPRAASECVGCLVRSGGTRR